MSSLMLPWWLILVVVLAIIFPALLPKYKFKYKNKRRTKTKPRKSYLLTRPEYKMYFVLKEALPDCEIMVQVSFSALLHSDDHSVFNTYCRKRADYVVCNKDLYVIAVVELDDRTHIGNEKKDGERERLLTDAGYIVKRYSEIPEVETVKEEFKMILHPLTRGQLER